VKRFHYQLDYEAPIYEVLNCCVSDISDVKAYNYNIYFRKMAYYADAQQKIRRSLAK